MPTEASNKALRKALSEIVLLTKKVGKSIRTDIACGIIASKAKHALNEPLRNCDVGTAKKQTERMRTFCKRYRAGIGTCLACPISGIDPKHCALAWAQMPYKKSRRSVKRTEKRIVFNLKREWYDKIASGEKTVEYRELNEYWDKRLWVDPGPPNVVFNRMAISPKDGTDWLAVFRLGYSRKYPDIVRRITKIDIGPCPYKGWYGDYFRVHFEKGNYK